MKIKTLSFANQDLIDGYQFYEKYKNPILIYAVLDCRKNPTYIQKKLQKIQDVV